MKITPIFSELSKTGKVPPGISKAEAIAMALGDWGCVTGGAKQPANFGAGMADLSIKFDISALPENLIKEADKFLIFK